MSAICMQLIECCVIQCYKYVWPYIPSTSVVLPNTVNKFAGNIKFFFFLRADVPEHHRGVRVNTLSV
jgi:hypothetical protein